MTLPATPVPRRPLLILLLLLLAAPAAAAPSARAQLPLPEPDPVVVAAGDIACDPESEFYNAGLGDATHCRQQYTAQAVLREDPDVVLPLGDTQYEDAQLWKFQESYAPSWGRLKGISRPAIGNHEYFGDDGAGYFDYFNGPGAFSGPAGDRDKGYYSFDIGSWHVIALNSVCSRVGGCGPGSPQARWLRADLAANASACTLAYWHHPLFSSAGRGWPSMEPIWQVLYDAGVELVLAGHAHQYERFAPMDATGALDREFGIRQFVVGTGGKNLGSRRREVANSEAFSSTAFGALRLTLRDGGYDWRFVRESGGEFSDASSSPCHGRPGGRPPGVVTGSASAVGRSAARVHASVDPRNRPTTYRIEYGRSPAYGSATPETSLPGTTGGREPVSVRLTGLRPGRTYHYRVVATNELGTVVGADRTFRTGDVSRYARMILRTRGLLAYWRLGEQGEKVGFDDTGRTLGFYTGGHALGRRGAIAGDPDTAAAFDGTDGSLRGEGPIVGRSATIEGWFRWNGGRVLMRDDSSTGGWFLAGAGDGRLTYRVGGKSFVTGRRTGAVQDGAWHHLALTKHGRLAQLFVDGRRVHVAYSAGDAPATMPWYVMRNGPFEEHAAGLADEIAIYARALPAAVVRRHYRAGAGRSAPETFLSAPAGAINRNRPRITFRAGEPLAGARCSLTGPGRSPAVEPCRSPRFPGPLADGRYTFSVYGIDRAGYPDPTPARSTFTVDTRTPLAALTVAEGSLRRLVRHGLSTTVDCDERCTVAARLTVDGREVRRRRLGRGPLEVARATGSASTRAPARLRLRLSRSVAGRLRRARSLTVTVRAVASDRAGNRRHLAQKLTLRR